MYCVSGCESIGPSSTSSSESGLRRQAFSFSEPLRKALTATLASVLAVMPWSCMYRWIFRPKNCVVSISPVSPYQSPRPQSAGFGSNAPRGCLSNPMAMTTSAAPALMAL